MPVHPDSRYARQMMLPGVGAEGQQRLRHASVLIVGIGGLGCPMALYLAAAGVGRLVLVDDDRVDVSNLHRQVLYGPADIGRPKAEAAAERLRAFSPEVEIVPHAERLTASNIRPLVRGCDVVADGSDNFATRYLVSDACVLEGKPCAHASVLRFEGQLTVLHHAGGPCYRCLYPAPPPPGVMPDCNAGGVLGPVVGSIAALQATEVLKLLLGVGDVLAGRLLLLDALGAASRTVRFDRLPECPACGDAPTIRDVAGVTFSAPRDGWTLDAGEARARLASADPPLLLDVRSPEEHAARNLGGRLVPLPELSGMLATFDASRPLLVYCQSGARSARAAALLREAGLTAYTLGGGIDAWPEPPARS